MSTEPPTAVTVVTYQFKTDDEEWEAWKETVPRSKSLDTRLRELMKADREGRVLEPDPDADKPSKEYHDAVDDVVRDTPVIDEVVSQWSDTDDRLQQRRDAAEAALEHIKSDGQLGKTTATEEIDRPKSRYRVASRRFSERTCE